MGVTEDAYHTRTKNSTELYTSHIELDLTVVNVGGKTNRYYNMVKTEKQFSCFVVSEMFK